MFVPVLGVILSIDLTTLVRHVQYLLRSRSLSLPKRVAAVLRIWYIRRFSEPQNGILAKAVIEPLYEFNYEDVEPISYRPFKSKAHVTMGILL